MDTEQPNQQAEKPNLPTLRTLIAATRTSVQATESVVGRPRQILAAAALGTCLVFIAGMLSLPRLDQPLTIALYAFVVAVPLLILYHYCASFRPDTETQSGLGWLLLILLVAGVRLGETPGLLATFGGIVAVVWHLNDTAGITLVAWTAGIAVLWIISTVILAYFTAWQVMREGRKSKQPKL